MVLKPIPLTEAELKSNYEHWLKSLSYANAPSEELLSILKDKLCTTHTFPFIRDTSSGTVIPYEVIFSDTEENGLLSNGFREFKNINPDDDKSSRNFPAGLKNYVFSYLGIHQPYYGRVKEDKVGIHSKPFGVFIKSPSFDTVIENFPHNHASRRDLGKDNEDVDQKKVHLETLLAGDARLLMSYQICNDEIHKVSENQMECFWHYYGNSDYWENTEEYADNSWKKKAEFRFFEKLEVSDIAAVLWPVWIDEKNDETGEEFYSRTHDDVVQYQLKYPDIRFILYDLDLRDPELCFIEASYVALRFFLKYHKFPEYDISIAKNVLDI